MTPGNPLERVALDEVESRRRKRGYTLVREPTPDQLPEFLRGSRPDAIAVGAQPSLVIEILPGRGRTSQAKVRQLSHLVEGRDDWPECRGAGGERDRRRNQASLRI